LKFALNLARAYGIKRMKIILNGRKVGNGDDACYFESKAYFSKKGLNKSTILYELYHHLIEAKGLEMPYRKKEKEANNYTSEFVKKS
jgi:hypothetical protein